MIDTYGVPEFYSDVAGDIEDAGNGMIRIVRCIRRGEQLVPVFSCITPAANMLQDGPRFRAICLQVLGMAMSSH